MKKITRIAIVSLTTLALSSSVLPSISTYADTVNNNRKITVVNSSSTDSINQEINDDRQDLINDGNFNNSELNKLSNQDIIDLHNHLYNVDNRMGAGKVAKLVLKAWKHLPKPIKRKMAKYTSLYGFLKVINHYSGTEDHIIYKACRYVGMSKWWASFSTKTITLFID